MSKLSPQMSRKILASVEPTMCDQCGESLQANNNDGEWFHSSNNWSGVLMVYCRGCEDRRAEKFDDVQNCAVCDSIVVEDDIVWYNAGTGRLDTDKGDPYCVGCVPNEEPASV